MVSGSRSFKIYSRRHRGRTGCRQGDHLKTLHLTSKWASR